MPSVIAFLKPYYKYIAWGVAAAVLAGGLWMLGGKALEKWEQHKRAQWGAEIAVKLQNAAKHEQAAFELKGQLTQALQERDEKNARAVKAESRLAQLQANPVEKPVVDSPECQAVVDALHEQFQERENELVQMVVIEKDAREAAEEALQISLARSEQLELANTDLHQVVDTQGKIIGSLTTSLEKAQASAKRWRITSLISLSVNAVQGGISIKW